MRASQEQSEATTLFLDSQVRSLGQQLEDTEAKVRAFEGEHEGSLPQQLQSNIQILQGIQCKCRPRRRRERAISNRLSDSLQNQYQSMSDNAVGHQLTRIWKLHACLWPTWKPDIPTIIRISRS